MLKCAAVDKNVSPKEIVDRARELGVPVDEVALGTVVEREHSSEGPSNGRYTVANDDETSMDIASAHIKELPDYYERLEEMESEGKQELSKKASALGRLMRAIIAM